jgi:hypothetical protein
MSKRHGYGPATPHGIDRERMAPPGVPERRSHQFDIVGEQPQPALGQIHREE